MANFTTIQLPDGGLYIGGVDENGLPHDVKATCTWPNGRSYRGSWIAGTMSGVGTIYQNGKPVQYGYWWKGELLHEFGKETTDNPPLPEGRKNKQRIAALLIGNNNYKDNPLNNCINDVKAIAAELRSLDIDVEVLTDCTKDVLEESIIKFTEKSSNNEYGLFYFSGHGNLIQGRHCITAIDENESQTGLISIELIDETLSKHSNYKNFILISDACTTIVNSSGNNKTPEISGKSVLVFSSSLGSASDGIPGEHSPFAYGLLRHIKEDLRLIDVLHKANNFCFAYALNHELYQCPQLQVYPNFNTEFKLFL